MQRKLPPAEFQRAWCGMDGEALNAQSLAFYRGLKETVAAYCPRPFGDCAVLDFGCGWGRLARCLADDLLAGQIFGCDPDPEALKWCEGLLGTFALSDPRPARLPFNQKFDVIYAYSVFTHLSEATHRECLDAMLDSLTPTGIIVLTVRPRAYLEKRGGDLARLPGEAIDALCRAYDAGEYVFVGHNREPIGGEITYGEAAVPPAYMIANWPPHRVTQFGIDPFQVPVVISSPTG